jgi:hypothetical protein
MVPTPPPTTAEPTPSPITDTPVPQSQYRTFQELTGSGASHNFPWMLGNCKHTTIPNFIVTDTFNYYPGNIFRKKNNFKGIEYFGQVSDVKLEALRLTLNKVNEMLVKASIFITTSDTIGSAAALLKNQIGLVSLIASRYGGLYRNFISAGAELISFQGLYKLEHLVLLSYILGHEDNVVFSYDCNEPIAFYLNKDISLGAYANTFYICNGYTRLPELPSVTKAVHTQFGAIIQGLAAVYYKNTDFSTIDKCMEDSQFKEDIVLPSNVNPACVGYFMEAAYAFTICKENVCNATTVEISDVTEVLPKINSVLEIKQLSYLDDAMSSAFKLYLQKTGPASGWTFIRPLLDDITKILAKKQTDFIYGDLTNVCIQHTDKDERYGYVQNSLDFSLFLCQGFREVDRFPLVDKLVSKFHVLAHELSHFSGTSDYSAANSDSIYGEDNCKIWAEDHPPFGTGSIVIADCFAFFLDLGYINAL